MRIDVIADEKLIIKIIKKYEHFIKLNLSKVSINVMVFCFLIAVYTFLKYFNIFRYLF